MRWPGGWWIHLFLSIPAWRFAFPSESMLHQWLSHQSTSYFISPFFSSKLIIVHSKFTYEFPKNNLHINRGRPRILIWEQVNILRIWKYAPKLEECGQMIRPKCPSLLAAFLEVHIYKVRPLGSHLVNAKSINYMPDVPFWNGWFPFQHDSRIGTQYTWEKKQERWIGKEKEYIYI